MAISYGIIDPANIFAGNLKEDHRSDHTSCHGIQREHRTYLGLGGGIYRIIDRSFLGIHQQVWSRVMDRQGQFRHQRGWIVRSVYEALVSHRFRGALNVK